MATEQAFPALALPGAGACTSARGARQWHVVIAGLIVMDLLALGAAFAIAYLIRFKTGLPFLATPPNHVAFYSSVLLWAAPLWLGVFVLYRLYDRRDLFADFQEYARVVNACSCGMMATVVLGFLGRTLEISRGWLLLVWVLSILFICTARFAVRRLVAWARRDGWLVTRTVVVGANEEGRALVQQFRSHPGSGTQVVGFVDNTVCPGTVVEDHLVSLGTLQSLEQVVRDQRVNEIVVAMTAVTRDDLLFLYRTFGHAEEVEVRLSSGLFEILTTGVRVQETSRVALMTPQRVRITGVDAALKLIVDYTVAFLSLLALSPIVVVVALLVKLDSPGPVLYRRRVLGRSGRPFDAFKFRTMVVDADAVLAADVPLRAAFETGYKLKVDPRVTRVGRILRRTSVDELPQLVNVLRGEMSLIGPRMIAPDEASRYGKWLLNLLTVKPGITGPWQVRGRSDIPYDERVRLSMHYIRNYSLWMDLEILLRTVPAVLRSAGAY